MHSVGFLRALSATIKSPGDTASDVAEDARITGSAREALALVISHNVEAAAAHERHPARPLCDTTHCQVFLGTARSAQPRDRAIFDEPSARFAAAAHGARSFLSFAKGGSLPWRETRPLAQVGAALGPVDLAHTRIEDGAVISVCTNIDGHDAFDESVRIPCELMRNELRLPSCPRSFVVEGTSVGFAGSGEGHGVGLDVELAKTMSAQGATADEILREAYPP